MHATEKMTAMDDIDSAIIEVLLSDGRATYARIGGAVGLSVAATKRRIDRLLRDNVIRGFTAVVDPQVLGWTLEAQVQLFTNGTVPFPTMRRDLERLPEVIEASTVSGSADAVLRVVAADVVQLERVISRLRGLSYVQQTDTTMLLSRLLSRPVAGPLIRAHGG
jgi:DNA-binding Lrp family transcriptional regulator